MLREEYKVKDICSAMSVCRSRYYRSLNEPWPKAKVARPVFHVDGTSMADEAVLERMKKIQTDHPFWGYRRITAWLQHREGICINRKKVYRLMKDNGLLQTKNKHREPRPMRSKPQATRPDQVWGIDMTKFMLNGIGWIYLVLIIDWYTKKILAWDISLRSRSQEWRDVLNMAVLNQLPDGSRGMEVGLVSDNGSQPTSVAFMKDCKTLGINQIFTSYNNPKGNADTERVMRTLKEEKIWLNEWPSLEEARTGIADAVKFYNELYPHSALGYSSPVEFENMYKETILNIA